MTSYPIKFRLLLVCIATAVFGHNLFAQEKLCNYLVWQDEFNEAGAPDPGKWSYDIGGHGWGNQELQTYTNSRANSFVEDGKLTIRALKTNGSWTSARLVTKGKGDWLYGRIEVKAKLPSGKGTWPAIWMLPTDWEYGGWPKSGEIDIMEHVGYDFGNVHGTIHTEAYNHSIGTQKGGSVEVENVASQFHVYAIDWTEDEIIWYVDGEEYYRFENPDKSYKEWPFDKRFHLILNIAIGGTWGGAQGIDPNLKEATMEIDYVRVYKKKVPAPVINGKKNAEPGEELSFSTAEIQGINYNWSFPEGVQVLNGDNTAQVTVKWGKQGGDVFLEIQSECDTVSAAPFYVNTIIIPAGESFEVPLFDEENNALWQVVPGSSNQMELSGTASLIVDYTIHATGENPHILYMFQRPVNLSSYSEMEMVLKTPSPAPGSFRIDLIDVNGNINLNDLFKINSFESDGEFHTFSHKFGQNPDGVYDLSRIKSIKIYINYGLFGKMGSGQIEIQSVKFVNPTTGIPVLQKNTDVKIRPNPFTDHLRVSSKTEILRIEIYDANGSLLRILAGETALSKKIKLENSPGVVFLKVIFADRSSTFVKAVKQ
ncbi:MAG: family 16 glycosylhydrolase [Prolixibacteraceae bacterium]